MLDQRLRARVPSPDELRSAQRRAKGKAEVECARRLERVAAARRAHLRTTTAPDAAGCACRKLQTFRSAPRSETKQTRSTERGGSKPGNRAQLAKFPRLRSSSACAPWLVVRSLASTSSACGPCAPSPHRPSSPAHRLAKPRRLAPASQHVLRVHRRPRSARPARCARRRTPQSTSARQPRRASPSAAPRQALPARPRDYLPPDDDARLRRRDRLADGLELFLADDPPARTVWRRDGHQGSRRRDDVPRLDLRSPLRRADHDQRHRDAPQADVLRPTRHLPRQVPHARRQAVRRRRPECVPLPRRAALRLAQAFSFSGAALTLFFTCSQTSTGCVRSVLALDVAAGCSSA